MKGHDKNKTSTNLDLFDNANRQTGQSTDVPNSDETTSNHSKVICFATASKNLRSDASASLKEKAMKLILDRANKLTW